MTGDVKRRVGWLPLPLLILVVVSIYSYPLVRGWWDNRPAELPLSLAPDQYYYLLAASLTGEEAGTEMSPWYGQPLGDSVSSNSLLTPALRLFDISRRELNLSWIGGLEVWNAVLTGLICVSLWFLVLQLGAREGILLVAWTIVAGMLLNLSELREAAIAWMSGFEAPSSGPRLPYVRPFTPQFTIPVLFGYLGLQARALRSSSRWPWVLMVLLQYLSLVSFPFATILMAGSTGLAVLFVWISARRLEQWRAIVVFAASCVVVDVQLNPWSLNLATSAGSKEPAATVGAATSSTALGLADFVSLIGGTHVLLVVFSLVSLVLGRKLPFTSRATAAAPGLVVVAMTLCDPFVNPSMLWYSYCGYLVHSAGVIALVSISASLMGLSRVAPWARRIMVASGLLFLVHGSRASHKTFMGDAALHGDRADVEELLVGLDLERSDLVIAPVGKSLHEMQSWVPLASDANVLFSRHALLFSNGPEQRSEHWERLSLLLYLRGGDAQWLEGVLLRDEGLKWELSYFLGTGPGQFESGAEKKAARRVRYAQLAPALDRLLEGNPPDLFCRYRSIVAIDDAERPELDPARLAQFLVESQRARAGSFEATTYHRTFSCKQHR